ncbi:NAD-dependent epimerase/dehydratase family protein [Allorhizobium terrae]|uniref:UDP-glucose 4-epimerase n=1 Tax=Allorhizobium terrae TaxID=1848972 RepID=A0A4S3ZVJ0_9HYPH|nr:NAD-dependent epimerase/dehydratase family protein [Allorhizobium terrae]THF49751.1 NAD-dependent epimerase/dehydratase family protein [Allorhizobium terrae]
MNILVIGGAGFIGYHLVHDLLDAGHMVTVLGRSEQPTRPLPLGVRYLSGDLSNAAQLKDCLAGIDAVAHLASGTVPATGDKDPIADVNMNLNGTLNLLMAMEACNVKRLLFLSSGGTVYGPPQEVPISVHHPLAPICSYGIVKVAIESYLKLFERNAGLRPIVIRASNPYGSHQGNLGVQGIIGTYLNLASQRRPLEIWGDGSTIRDFIYIKDLTSLCVKSLESDKVGIYNGGSGTGTSVLAIAQLVQDITGNPAPIVYKPHRNLDVPISILDVETTKADFDWKPEIGIKEGILKTWDWLHIA